MTTYNEARTALLGRLTQPTTDAQNVASALLALEQAYGLFLLHPQGEPPPATTPPGVTPPLPPAAPQPVSPPAIGGTVVAVATDQELRSLLLGPRGPVTDIVLTGGTYTGTEHLTIPGHWTSVNIWGPATLEYGVLLAGTAAPAPGSMQGVNFDIADPGLAIYASAVAFVGQRARGYRLTDATFSLNGVVDHAISVSSAAEAHAVSGMQLLHIHVQDSSSVPLYVTPAWAAPDVLPVFADWRVERAFATPRGSENGTGEAACLIGQPALVQRWHIRDCGWAGVIISAPADDAGGVVSDIDCDVVGPGAKGGLFKFPAGAAVYLDRAHDWAVHSIKAGPLCRGAVNLEHGDRVSDIDISDVDSEAYSIGVHIDDGVDNVHVERCLFRKAWNGGIRRAAGATGVTVDMESCVFELEDGHAGNYVVGPHGGPHAQPPSGWRFHPAQFGANVNPGADAVFFGFSAAGQPAQWSLNTAGEDLVLHTSGNSASVANMAHDLQGPQTLELMFELTPSTTGRLCRVRGETGGATLVWVSVDPADGMPTQFEIAIGGQVNHWAPWNFPFLPERCLLSLSTAANADTQSAGDAFRTTARFWCLDEATYDETSWTHPAPLSATGVPVFIVGSETEFGSAEYSGYIYGVRRLARSSSVEDVVKAWSQQLRVL